MSQDTPEPREGINLQIEGIQGTLNVGAEVRDEEETVIWIGPDNDEVAPIGVDPVALRAAIAFVLGEAGA